MALPGGMNLCTGCRHFYLQTAEEECCDLSPARSFDISCVKGQWEFDSFNASARDLETVLTTAARCPYFEAGEWRASWVDDPKK